MWPGEVASQSLAREGDYGRGRPWIHEGLCAGIRGSCSRHLAVGGGLGGSQAPPAQHRILGLKMLVALEIPLFFTGTREMVLMTMFPPSF